MSIRNQRYLLYCKPATSGSSSPTYGWCKILMLQVKEFWPRYWGGAVIYDRGMEFFKALGGGKLLKEKFLSGFVFNPRAIANYKRAKAMGIQQNFKGEGEIKGGLFIVGSGKSGIAYQFIERNFGDWAPIAEVLDICTQLQVFLLAFPILLRLQQKYAYI